MTVLALGGAVVLVGGIFLGLTRSADEQMKRQGYFDSEVDLPPGKPFGYTLAVALSSSYRFEVTPLDGPAVMAVGRVDDGDTEKMSEEDVAQALKSAQRVEAGKTGRVAGQLERGRYVWVVLNPSKEKPVRVKIRFG